MIMLDMIPVVVRTYDAIMEIVIMPTVHSSNSYTAQYAQGFSVLYKCK